MRAQVGGEMPMKPGAMSRTNPAFSRWPYGVDQGAPNALQWNCASSSAQGIVPARRRREPRRWRSRAAAATIPAAGADGYANATASAQKNPHQNGRKSPQNAQRNAAPSASAAIWCPANIWPYVSERDPRAPARVQTRAAVSGTPESSIHRRKRIQKATEGRITQIQRSANTAGVFFSGPKILIAASTGAPSSEVAGAFAANSRPAQAGGCARGSSQVSALSFT